MDVIAETSVLVTSKAQTFCWAGYGLKLHIPKGALPADVEECRILIKVGLSGQFKLPENTSIVSAIYWLNSEAQCNFSQPLTLEIQHCAKSTQTERLRFAGCSQNSPPYTFKMLERGEFSYLSAYGSMQFHGFSLITLLMNRPLWLTRIESVKYRARLYYLMRGEDQREIHFLITKDLDSHATVRLFEKTQCAIYAITYIILHRTFNRNMLPKVPQLDQTCQLSLNQIAFHCSYLLRKIYVMMDGILFHDFL